MVKSNKEIMDNLRKASFASLGRIPLPFDISKDDVRNYFKKKFDVDSWTKFTEKEFCYVDARLRAASNDRRILEGLLNSVRKFKATK